MPHYTEPAKSSQEFSLMMANKPTVESLFFTEGMAPPVEISKSNFETELDQLKKQLEFFQKEEQQLMQRLNNQSPTSPKNL
jgi:hypothetical protein